ncbi:1-acyl-sn-glycerol-3-phosphate acyltransferase, partial [Variovorax sp. RHLX14]
VFIDTDSPYLAKGWPLWRVPPLPIVFTLRIGKRFSPTQDSDVLQAELEQYFRQNMEQRATEASPECQTPRAPTLS